MRLTTVRTLGLYVRDRRRNLSLTQTELATAAQVSRRWLSDLEGGKATAEVGLVLRVLGTLNLVLDVKPDVSPDATDPHARTLDHVIRRHTGPTGQANSDA